VKNINNTTNLRTSKYVTNESTKNLEIIIQTSMFHTLKIYINPALKPK